ncbi:molybdopterin converting factor subunit 1 [Aneurinibacillus terranovensis]|uniref:molybdopterin converting factor subunit 1 n=1 Tax=Aneurinibacillus terranovensis TaxID=278991 RepID=UPI00040C06A4|nr:molybdopterin converting factor subunit 1 [Aneurinibacillus terranovensis]
MIRIKLFAAMAEEAGKDTLEFEWQPNMTTDDVKRWLVETYPVLESRLPAAMIAVNHEFAAGTKPLNKNDEVAFIPPVSGG